MDIRECVVCHKSYQPVKGNQKKCPVCKTKYVQKSKLHTVVCSYCHKEFTTTLYNKEYCSATCREAGPKSRRPTYDRICAYCGKPFTATKITVNACSKECRREVKRIKDNAWRTKHVPV